jgi:hypothetical protein
MSNHENSSAADKKPVTVIEVVLLAVKAYKTAYSHLSGG